MIQYQNKRWIGGVLLFPIVLIFVAVGTVFAQSSTNYNIKKSVADQGGAPSQSTNYKVIDIVGQPSAIGGSASTNYSLSAGFLDAPAVITPMATVILPADASGAQGSIVSIPIKVTTDSTIGVAQFVIDYNSSVLTFQNAQLGAETPAADFSIIFNPSLAFPPATPGTNENVSVQVSSGASSFMGAEQEVAVLTFNVVGSTGQNSPLGCDRDPAHTSLTTTNLFDINNGNLIFQDGMFTVTTGFSVSGTVSYHTGSQPVSAAQIALTHSGGTLTTNTYTPGFYVFTGLSGGAITLTPSKTGDVSKITGSDALLILRYLAFLETLTEEQKIAADVTMDGAVSGADALAILRYLAFFTTNIGYTGEWTFNPSNISTTLAGNLTNQNFTAYLLGEATGDWGTAAPAHMIAQSQLSTQMQKGALEKIPTVSLTLSKTTSSLGAQTSATLILPTISGALAAAVSVPVQVTTDSTIGLAQFVVEYDSIILHFENAQVGSGVSGFAVSLVNADLPFSPTTPGANDNVLVQVSGGGSASFTGTDVEVVVLNFTVIGSSGDSPLAFDQGSNKTFLTTSRLHDITSTSLTFVDGAFTVITSVAIGEHAQVPVTFELSQNYPNPFNPNTIINFTVPNKYVNGVQVSFKIFNIEGQIIRRLVDENRTPGFYSVVWDGKNDRDDWVSSGIYFYTLNLGEFRATRKMILLK